MGGEKLALYSMPVLLIGLPPRRRGKVAVNQCFDQALRITPALAGKRRPQQRHRMALQDHPRVGGEKPRQRCEKASSIGSPPRGRGKVLSRCLDNLVDGITPAWAGKRTGASASWTTVRDHPRMGGEKKYNVKDFHPHKGSPPRRRGKVDSVEKVRSATGVTPAWAGKRWAVLTRSVQRRDHPRMGGEKPFLFCGGSSDSGSPPHGRGKDE